MIPSVEERQVRPCGFSQDIRDVCIWFLLATQHVGIKHCERPSFHDVIPCKFHITRDELLELTTQHNAGELPLDWLWAKIQVRIMNRNSDCMSPVDHALNAELRWVQSLLQQPRQEGK